MCGFSVSWAWKKACCTSGICNALASEDKSVDLLGDSSDGAARQGPSEGQLGPTQDRQLGRGSLLVKDVVGVERCKEALLQGGRCKTQAEASRDGLVASHLEGVAADVPKTTGSHLSRRDTRGRILRREGTSTGAARTALDLCLPIQYDSSCCGRERC